MYFLRIKMENNGTVSSVLNYFYHLELELEHTEVPFGGDYGEAFFQLQLPIGDGINSFTYESLQNVL